MDTQSWNTMDSASQVTICMKMLYERQLTTTSGGNVSVRDENNTVWVTPSVIVAYTPCQAHGIKLGMCNVQEEMKRAVDSGYWNLYHYNPLEAQPLTVDSKEPVMDYMDFLDGEVRYASLKKAFPENAKELFELGEKQAKERYERYKHMEENQ